MRKGHYIKDSKLSMVGVPEHIVQMSLTSKGDSMSTTTTNLIELPQEMRNKITNPTLVEKRLSDYWNNNISLIEGYSTARLLGVKAEYEALGHYLSDEDFDQYVGDLDNPNTTGKFKSTLRLTLGYNLLTPTLTHSVVGLFSSKALQLKLKRAMGDSCTEDHLFGVTEIGTQVFLAYKNSDWDLDYIVNEWLPQHLYLWLTVKILKAEHQGDNSIARGKHTLEEKVALQHYDDVNVPIEVHM